MPPKEYRPKFIFGLVAFSILVTLFVVILILRGTSPAGLIENRSTPEEYWLREITTERWPSTRVVTNSFDGYKISVPHEWLVTDHASQDGLLIYFDEKTPSEVPGEGYESGGTLSILAIDTPQPISLDDWVNSEGRLYLTNPSDITLLKETALPGRSYKALSLSRIWIDEWDPNHREAVTILFISDGDSKIFRVTCSIVEEDYAALHDLCVQYAKTFEIVQ